MLKTLPLSPEALWKTARFDWHSYNFDGKVVTSSTKTNFQLKCNWVSKDQWTLKLIFDHVRIPISSYDLSTFCGLSKSVWKFLERFFTILLKFDELATFLKEQNIWKLTFRFATCLLIKTDCFRTILRNHRWLDEYSLLLKMSRLRWVKQSCSAQISSISFWSYEGSLDFPRELTVLSVTNQLFYL